MKKLGLFAELLSFVFALSILHSQFSIVFVMPASAMFGRAAGGSCTGADQGATFMVSAAVMLFECVSPSSARADGGALRFAMMSSVVRTRLCRGRRDKESEA